MKNKNLIIKLLLVLLVLVSSINLISYYLDYKSSKKIYESVYKPETPSIKNREPEENLAKLFNGYYEDVVGYIDIDNTKVHYPIVQSEDNEFYLDHNIEGEKSISGSVFLDFSNKKDFSDDNSVVYGHNMKSGDYFNSLHKFKDQSFYEENKKIKLYTLDDSLEYEIFSVHVSNEDYDYRTTEFSSVEEKIAFIEKLKNKSMIDTDPLDLSRLESAKIITLSTCTGSDILRLAVHAIIY